MKAARRMLAYLNGTKDEGITFFSAADATDLNKLFGWVDSDYAAQLAL